MFKLIGPVRHFHVVLVSACGLFAGLGLASPAQAAGDAAAVFKTKCTGCHTFGKGIRVGPDLKGVTDRHPREWLIDWIQSSTKVIQSGDPTAVALFRTFKEQRMPDHDLSRLQISALIDYLAAGGPDADEQQRIRDASTASAADIELGRQLFFGETRLKSGDLACVSCHAVAPQSALGGQLATDLSNVYGRYHDKALDQVLKHACLPRSPALQASRVEDHESLALRAFLRTIDRDTRRTDIAATKHETGSQDEKAHESAPQRGPTR
jgi:mono/diheme cytochrome c family protein